MSVICGTRMIQAQEKKVAGSSLARVEQRQAPGGPSVAAAHSHTATSLCELGTAGSQQRRTNARWAAVGEASEASRNADVTIAHAHAQQYAASVRGGAQAARLESEWHTHPNRHPESRFRTTTLTRTVTLRISLCGREARLAAATFRIGSRSRCRKRPRSVVRFAEPRAARGQDDLFIAIT